MSSETTRSLVRLVDELESRGEASERVQLARCALAFRRSWVELAEVLVQARDSEQFKEWGFTDFLGYCQAELNLKRGLVDKLTVSYRALNKYAPRQLREETEEPLPSYSAIDYFSRAVGEPRSDGRPPRDAPDQAPTPTVLKQLRTAVFEEGQSLRKLRENFDPILRPKGHAEQQLLALRRARMAAQRLLEHLSEIDGLSEEILPGVEEALEQLQTELDGLTDQLSEAEQAEAS